MTSGAWLIDPPELLAPREEWQRHLDMLRRLPEPDDAVREAIREAERQVRGDRSGGDVDEPELIAAFKAAQKGR